MPFIEKYGSDSVRYWASSSVLGEDNSFQEKDVVTGSRLINKLWNVARFISMNRTNYEPLAKGAMPSDMIDYWVYCKMSEAVRKATECFESYDYFKARNIAEEFFWEFANNYMEFVKNRVYAKDPAASRMLDEVLLAVMKMFSPFMPFVNEELYQTVFLTNSNFHDREKSIHISPWPLSGKFDEKKFAEADKVIKLILFIRKWKHDNGQALNSDIAELIVESDMGDAARDVMGAMNVKKITMGKGTIQVPETDLTVEIKKE
jgi:valyl-tRNA synthetase